MLLWLYQFYLSFTLRNIWRVSRFLVCGLTCFNHLVLSFKNLYVSDIPEIQGVPKKMRLHFCLISLQPIIGFSNRFFSPENWDPYARVIYSKIFERCLGAEIFKKQNQGTFDRKGPSRIPPLSKLTNFFHRSLDNGQT